MSKIRDFNFKIRDVAFLIILDAYKTFLITAKISVNFKKIPLLVSFIFTLFGTKNESTHCILS
tara:strand:- start:491 stop:679 length:189 start_codon:yes stop_codon:yes gene_type:complete